jgi:aminoglycoside phosphotransferase (APT) family kinase protein
LRGLRLGQGVEVVQPDAMAAAIRAGQQHGLRAANPVVVQETNNVVVWLRPHEVIAKVGAGLDRAEALRREYHVARALAELGAPVAQPLPATRPVVDVATGLTVTFWHRLEEDRMLTPDAKTLGSSLRELHGLLAKCTIELPDFREELWRARRALDDESAVAALPPADREFLWEVFDTLMPDLEARQFRRRPLHGEPHDGNRLLTPDGVRWIDFERTCLGPLEWDLAFLSNDARQSFEEIDANLMHLLSLLNSGRVATWCWIRAHFPQMRWHAEHHLGILRTAGPLGQRTRPDALAALGAGKTVIASWHPVKAGTRKALGRSSTAKRAHSGTASN